MKKRKKERALEASAISKLEIRKLVFFIVIPKRISHTWPQLNRYEVTIKSQLMLRTLKVVNITNERKLMTLKTERQAK